MDKRICGSCNVRIARLIYSKEELIALGVSERVAQRRPEAAHLVQLCTQVITSAVAEKDDVWLVMYDGQIVPFHVDEVELCQ